MSAALDRQIRPIYDALDIGSNKSAIVQCNKVLKKSPDNVLVKALKALALLRSQKVDETLVLADEVLATKPTHDNILTAMMHVLRGLGRNNDMIAMFDEAYKKDPTNEDLGAQTFFANMRISNWKAAQQISSRMHKQTQEDRYLYWNIMSTILQANDRSTPPNLRTVLYKLAHRLITSSPTPAYLHADRFFLQLSTMRELELWDEAEKLLNSDVGRNICATSLACEEIRRDIWRRRGLHIEDGEIASQRILEKNDRNWLEFVSVLDATFSGDSDCKTHIEKTHGLLTRVAEQDGASDRSAKLALLELERRSKEYAPSDDLSRMLQMLQDYFERLGDKSCCFEDMKPFIPRDEQPLRDWVSFLENQPQSTDNIKDLWRLINVHKLSRYALSGLDLTVDAEKARVTKLVSQYLASLGLGADLAATELQPSDDLCILAVNVLVNLWTLTSNESHLYEACCLLEYALLKSKQAFQVRLMLIRLYRLLGAPSLALEHFRGMNVKQVQQDTLSHFILSRSSMFSLGAFGDLTMITECVENSQIYGSNTQETGEFISRAFISEKYSQIPEFIEFERRLENSIQRDVTRVEQLRMRFTHEPLVSELIDMDLIELKFIYDRCHEDNRDFAILPNYQPRTVESFEKQTRLFGKTENPGWLWAFLTVYVRAFQHSSDLDETVEEKLLVGDRPKKGLDPELHPSLRNIIKGFSDEVLQECTEDERSLIEYSTSLAEWLGPHNDYVRPPASVVLAEAAKQSELRTGRPLKGFDIPPSNGPPSNGSAKKDQEQPAILEVPELVSTFFDKLKARFEGVIGQESPVAALHIAGLAQEALILLVLESQRFKPTVVKIHKLGLLVQSVKGVRTRAISVLKEISRALQERAKKQDTVESRQEIVDSCSALKNPTIDHDFIVSTAKKIQESRKKVCEGVGKGMGKLCTTYAH